MVSITRKGYIELYYGDSLVSRHTALEEAFERALVHLAENQATEGYTGLYRVKYPDREIDLSSILVKTISPPPLLEFNDQGPPPSTWEVTQGGAATPLDLNLYFDVAVSITVKAGFSLPNGWALEAGVLSYDGTSSAASADVRFVAAGPRNSLEFVITVTTAGVDSPFYVLSKTDGSESGVEHRVYDPAAGSWGAWTPGEEAGVGGTQTPVAGTQLPGPFVFTDQTGVALDTIIESDAINITAEGHQLQLRRRSSSAYDTPRSAYAQVGTETTAHWYVTTALETGTARDDILLTINFSSWEQDVVNPPHQGTTTSYPGSTSTIDGEVDGFRVFHIADLHYSPSIPQRILDMTHVEIRGAQDGALFAASGEHVLEGDRAMLLNIYHPEHDPLCDYWNPDYAYENGRPRIDCRVTPALLQRVYTLPRYSTTKGLHDEFWNGFALWYPPGFVFDKGTGANLAVSGAGGSNDSACWNVSMPATGSPVFRFECRNWGGGDITVGSIVSNHFVGESATFDIPATSAWQGTHQFWVIHFKQDQSGFNGFLRAWVNRPGLAPQLICNVTNAKFGAKDTDYLRWDYANTYKSGLATHWLAGTYGGLLTDPDNNLYHRRIVVGFDSWRLGGDQSNFQSVHPLRQAEP